MWVQVHCPYPHIHRWLHRAVVFFQASLESTRNFSQVIWNVACGHRWRWPPFLLLVSNCLNILLKMFIFTYSFGAVFQGTGLEVLIFCTFSAIFFLAACTISLCRRPRDLLTIAQPPMLPMDHHTAGGVRYADQQQQPLINQQNLTHQAQQQPNHHNSSIAQVI